MKTWSFGDWLMALTITTIVIGLLFIVTNTIQATGHVSYCYVEVSNTGTLPVYMVKGNVEWRPDRSISYFNEFNLAHETLTLCPVGK